MVQLYHDIIQIGYAKLKPRQICELLLAATLCLNVLTEIMQWQHVADLF
jgi:hypothetical protein